MTVFWFLLANPILWSYILPPPPSFFPLKLLIYISIEMLEVWAIIFELKHYRNTLLGFFEAELSPVIFYLVSFVALERLFLVIFVHNYWLILEQNRPVYIPRVSLD